jgi:ATP-dependent RNA helicase SUPV3L1/SUV3
MTHPGEAPSRLVAVLGATNTGKTHLAVERMLAHASGMIGLPLRLLAREIYDRIVAARGARAVALITGEEKIIPPRASYFVCTVEAMPVGRPVEFLAIDEIQLIADPERGHIFTDRLLNARGRGETMFLGAMTAAPLIRALLPGIEVQTRERYSALTFAGAKKLSRLPRRCAVVAFSAEEVYAIAELIRRQRGGAAVVMGSLSPRTRNAQVALYQGGEVDFLVATDAIGMGLNMDVDHVAFAGLTKFDGRRTRPLTPAEVGQIAGRAGRFRRDGSFGTTAACEEMDDSLIGAIEDHRFEPISQAIWRNSRLDFSSLKNLMASLDAPALRAGLKTAEEALDEKTLRLVAREGDLTERCKDRSHLLRLWDVCQTPDFRKTTLDDHARLVRDLFDQLTGRAGRVAEVWAEDHYRRLDRLDGEIEALSTRLAGVRTLAYIAHRPDWLNDAEGWRGRTRALEDRLSDTLHEKLMARFIDRRTSVLMKRLGAAEEVLAGVDAAGVVTVEGHFVGRLTGLAFESDRAATDLAAKTLRAAAQRVVGPEIARRLGALAADGDDAFALSPDGLVLWRGEAAGALTNDQPFAPGVRLFTELGPAPLRERAKRRLEAFVTAEAARRLPGLHRIHLALGEGDLRGLPRGLAFRLWEGGGVLDRAGAAGEIAALSQAERRTLRALGVRIGAYSLHLPAQLNPQSRAFAKPFADLAGEPLRARGLEGRLQAGTYSFQVEALERLDELMRAAERRNGGQVFTPAMAEALNWTLPEARATLRALGWTPVEKPRDDQAWHRRRTAEAAPADNRFAALAPLTQPDRRRPHRRKKKRAAGGPPNG